MEEIRKFDGQRVTFRPIKAVDGRLIQEYFYSIDEKDVQARFFAMRRSFFREDMEGMFQIDYITLKGINSITV